MTVMSKVQKVIYIDDVESKHLNKKKKNSSTLFVYLCCLSRCGRDFPSIGCVLQNGVLDSRWYKTAGFLQFGTALQQFVKSLEELAEAPASGKGSGKNYVSPFSPWPWTYTQSKKWESQVGPPEGVIVLYLCAPWRTALQTVPGEIPRCRFSPASRRFQDLCSQHFEFFFFTHSYFIGKKNVCLEPRDTFWNVKFHLVCSP